MVGVLVRGCGCSMMQIIEVVGALGECVLVCHGSLVNWRMQRVYRLFRSLQSAKNNSPALNNLLKRPIGARSRRLITPAGGDTCAHAQAQAQLTGDLAKLHGPAGGREPQYSRPGWAPLLRLFLATLCFTAARIRRLHNPRRVRKNQQPGGAGGGTERSAAVARHGTTGGAVWDAGCAY